MAELIAPKPAPAKENKSSQGPTLEILSGLHSGVTLPLEQGAYRIGSTAEADIVLRDKGVAKEHGVLRIERSGLRIEAVGGDIGIEGREALASGHGCRMTMPLEIALGDARIRVSDPHQTGKRGGGYPLAKGMIIAGGVGACVFAATVVAGVRLHQEPVPTVAPVQAALDATGTVKSSGNEQSAAATALSDQLASAGLNSLKLTTAGDQISVAGTVTPTEVEAWRGVQQWFDRVHAGKMVLVSNVVVGEARTMPSLVLQAIWLGDRPYLITGDGSKYYEGAFLDNGWTVKKIEQDKITLVKGSESFALTF